MFKYYTKVFQDFWKEQNFNKSSLYEIAVITVQKCNNNFETSFVSIF